MEEEQEKNFREEFLLTLDGEKRIISPVFRRTKSHE